MPPIALPHKPLRRAAASSGTVILCGRVLAENRWLAEAIRGAGYRIECRAHLDTAALAESSSDSIALLEVPNTGARAALNVLRELDPGARRRVLLVCWSWDHARLRPFVDVGVGDVLRMPASATELELRVRLRFGIRRDPKEPGPESHGDGAARDARSRRAVRIAESLSPREYALYQLLVERTGQVVTRAHAMERIWGRTSRRANASNILDVYIRYLRVKLAECAPHLRIVTVRGRGYRLRGET
ncbi:MAG TPA: winged helix-turn-helix domain-containing protein [Gemmatimonadaceae bacterium]|nr:winged helix-turn-helix domain-containing protein [Gemmatimonadaceae bacterium]